VRMIVSSASAVVRAWAGSRVRVGPEVLAVAEDGSRGRTPAA